MASTPTLKYLIRKAVLLCGIVCISRVSWGSDRPCNVLFSSTIVSTTYGDIPLDEYFSGKRSTVAAVLILHGSAGLLSKAPTDPSFDNLGENLLACSNFHVFIPHYMAVSKIASTLDPNVILKESPKWLAALQQVIEEIHKRDRHVVMYGYGYSLGGFMLLELATRSLQFAKISVVSAGLPPTEEIRLDRLPPILIQQGIEDTVVPRHIAEELNDSVASTIPHRLIEYPRLGHNLYYESHGAVARATVQFFLHN